MNHFWKPSQSASIMIAGIALGLLSAACSWAAGITISAGSVVVAPGSSMDSFEVDLTNLGGSSTTIAGFSFRLSVGSSDISLRDVSTATTSDYIFAGNSLFGPDLSGANNGQNISASDLVATSLSGTTVAAGQTVGLGEVFFNVSANATPGLYVIDFTAFPSTTISNASGSNVGIDTLSPGQIAITGTPEPSSVPILLFLTAAALAGQLRARSQRGKNKS